MMTSRIVGLVLLAGLLLGGLGGCNQTSKQAANAVTLYNIGEYPQSAAAMKPETEKKDENFVLNNCRYGSAALAAGQNAEAENAFMAAYEVINGVNTNNGGRTLGATLVFEGVKVWKGEPFERAMAHYYLGLAFLQKGDYENARSAFQNSLFKLREYAKESKESKDKDVYKPFESNFALGYFGLGFSYLRLGKPDQAEACFKQTVSLDPRLAPLVHDVQQPGVNTLIFVDAFSGPKRAAKGWYNEESAFGPTPAEVGPLGPVNVTADGQAITKETQRYNLVDTLAMAQDQKWQDIDTIRKTKAVIGTGAMAAGAGVAGYGASRGDAGMALAGVGVMALGAALAASSQADLRYWEMLPRTTYVIPAALAPGEHEIHVMVAGAGQTAAAKVVVNAPDPAKGPSDTVVYVRILR